MSSEQTFDYFITKKQQTYKKNFPLNQSAVQVIHHLSNEQNDESQKRPCCRQKTKMISQNDSIHSRQTLSLIKEETSHTDTENKPNDIAYSDTRADVIENSPPNHSKVHQQFSENHFRHNEYQNFNERLDQFLYHEKYESLENLGISYHAIRDNWQSDRSQKPSPYRSSSRRRSPSRHRSPSRQHPTSSHPSTSRHGSSSRRRSPSPRKTSTTKSRPHDPTLSAKEKQESPMLSLQTGPDTKHLYNEMNIRELVNTVRTEIGALIDADRNNPKARIILSNNKEKPINHNFPKEIRLISNNQNINLSALKKKQIRKSSKTKVNKQKTRKKKIPKSRKSSTRRKPKSETRKHIKSIIGEQKVKKNTLKPSDAIKPSTESSNTIAPIEQCDNCCCNFLHYSLRQVMHDAEQMKQFALNTAMTGMNPLEVKDPTNTLCPAICIPMYNCETIRDQRFPTGPTFTTISKNELNQTDNHQKQNKTNSMIIQTIKTQRGQIQIELDPQSFGLAPFFSEQYETFIKGPPNSLFFTNYINTYHKS